MWFERITYVLSGKHLWFLTDSNSELPKVMATKRVVGCKSIFQDFNTVFFLVRAGRASHSELFKTKQKLRRKCLFVFKLAVTLHGKRSFLDSRIALHKWGSNKTVSRLACPRFSKEMNEWTNLFLFAFLIFTARKPNFWEKLQSANLLMVLSDL